MGSAWSLGRLCGLSLVLSAGCAFMGLAFASVHFLINTPQFPASSLVLQCLVSFPVSVLCHVPSSPLLPVVSVMSPLALCSPWVLLPLLLTSLLYPAFHFHDLSFLLLTVQEVPRSAVTKAGADAEGKALCQRTVQEQEGFLPSEVRAYRCGLLSLSFPGGLETPSWALLKGSDPAGVGPGHINGSLKQDMVEEGAWHSGR